MKRGAIRLSTITILAGDEPPSEFRIFRAGWNQTDLGPVLFDAKAAKTIMEEFNRRGNDGMIDLEHLSLDPESEAYDPDARGAYRLAVRNGELWAVSVTYTADGEQRLREKRQRYISPVFWTDKENRLASFYNIALCAQPATHDAMPLVAASRKLFKLAQGQNDMDDLVKIAAALGMTDDSPTLEAVLAAIKTLRDGDGGEPAEPAGDASALTDEAQGDDMEKLGRVFVKAPKLLGRLNAALSTNKGLIERVQKLEQEQGSSKVQQLVAANTNRIPKHMEKWCLAQKPEVLESYIENLPAASPPAKQPEKEPGAGGGTVIALTADDLEMAKKCKQTPEQFLATKKKIHERERSRMSS